jgi:predicted tellurium resistance membrane protein TerC
LTGYLIEKALAIDTICVFYAIFAYFAVPAALIATGVLASLAIPPRAPAAADR